MARDIQLYFYISLSHNSTKIQYGRSWSVERTSEKYLFLPIQGLLVYTLPVYQLRTV